jgi:hypothetical protein
MGNFYLKNKALIFRTLFGLVLIYSLSALIVENKLSVLKVGLDNEIEREIEILSELAVTTGKGGFNLEAETIINDCRSDERGKFETLLSSLDSGLSQTELSSLNDLFSSCGYVFANRRTSMQMQMEREFNFLNDLVENRKLVGDFDENSINLSKWQELITTEKEINANFQNMVSVQKEIIDLLLSKKASDSDEVQSALVKAQELKGTLNTATERASSIRSTLISS